MSARDHELPDGDTTLDHLATQAESGQTTYLTRDGQRVAVVVPVEVADATDQPTVQG